MGMDDVDGKPGGGQRVGRSESIDGRSLLQVVGYCGELGEGGLEVFDDFGDDDVGIRKVGAVFEAFVFEQKMSRSLSR
jgi:hypothetical protein